jgi:hypothetical protein
MRRRDIHNERRGLGRGDERETEYGREISLRCWQQLHAAGTSLTARWLTGQAKSPLDNSTERDVDCLPDLAHSPSLPLSQPSPTSTPFPLPPPSCSQTLNTHLQTHHTPDTPSHTRARARTRLPILPHDARLKPLCPVWVPCIPYITWTRSHPLITRWGRCTCGAGRTAWLPLVRRLGE